MSASAVRYLQTLEDAPLEKTLTAWRAERPNMGVLVLLPEAEQRAVPRIQAICARLGIPLVGAIFPALVEHSAFRTQGAWLLRFDDMPHAALYPDLPRDAEKVPSAIDAIAADVISSLGDDSGATLLLLFDAMVPNIATLLDELYLRLANRVHYMGANAGSETFQPMPCLFDTSRVIQNGVLAILLKSHPGAVLEHGYGAPAQMLIATATEGNRIIQIDWRPAFEVYQEMARAQYGVEINRENFYQYAVHFPFGIMRANGMTLVRIPVALEQDGSLFCVGEVPPNALLALLNAPPVNSVTTVETLAQRLSELGPAPVGRDMLLFYCAGRRLHLSIQAAEDELKLFAGRCPGAEIAGALSPGEIGASSQWDYPLFHNATLVVSWWGQGRP